MLIEDFRSEVEDLEALCELCEEDETDEEMTKEFVSTRKIFFHGLKIWKSQVS